MKRFNEVMLTIWVVVIIAMVMTTGCAKHKSVGGYGWSIAANAKRSVLTIKYKDLSTVVKDIHLNLRNEGELLELSGWSVKEDNHKLTITTRKPKTTTWEFKITEKGVDINSSINNGVVTGIAPASLGRIPARVEAQDNGVIHNSLGFVSARDIYSLFDRKTDILIQFPKESNMIRNASNEEVMDITLPVIEGIELSLIPNYYTEELGLYHYEPYFPQYPDRHPFKKANTGWLNWYAYYMSSNQEDMVRETDALAKSLKPYGLEYVQLDATYSAGKDANLLEWNKEKFPKGGKWLMQYIKSKGFKPGLWVNVYGANYPNPSFADKYPENWFIHDKDGKLISACCTADSTVVQLDYSNPEVIEKHLKPLFKTLVEDWGIEYLKDAGHGMTITTHKENRERIYDSSLEATEVYWKVQDVVRNIMGPKNWIMGCDAEGGADKYCLGFGPFDSNFNIRDDVYAVWEQHVWASAMGTKMHLSTIFSTNYLNDIVLYNDPDATMVRPPLTMDEAVNNVTTIALSGQSYTISDFMSQLSEKRKKRVRTTTRWGREFPNLIKKLPEKRLELYKKTMPTTDITPIDLFPFRSNAEYAPLTDGYPEIDKFPKALDLKVNAESGIYDVVSVYNWSEKSDSKSISFEKDLGLDPEKKYLIFDFWNQEFKGIFKDKIQAEVPTHGVRVFVIRPLSDWPQFLASNRHITGAVSIEKLSWQPSSLTLMGTSKTITGATYTMWIYVPDGFTKLDVSANAKGISKSMIGNVLKLSCEGQKTPVNWKLEFDHNK